MKNKIRIAFFDTKDYDVASFEKSLPEFRAAHPETPVIFVTRPTFGNDYGPTDYESTRDRLRCREVVFRTYMDAVRAGDRCVDFIDGGSLFNGPYADICSVDNVHPNDAGFLRMAERIGQSVAKYLK